jgi:hypothetical protein
LTLSIERLVQHSESIGEVVARSNGKEEIPESVRALVLSVCEIAGSRTLIDDARVELASAGVIEAVKRRRNGTIFEWLMNAVSYQGVSDAAASGFIENHERVTSASINRQLQRKPTCPKLGGYHRFHGCLYRKTKNTCAEPLHKVGCPLPLLDLRNGRLNRTAFSLALFMRDVCMGDFVGWIDFQLRPTALTRLVPADVFAGPVIGPMTHIEGIGPKVMSMSMATLLLAADVDRPDWTAAGARMIAVDSLVHNFMHRSGILHLINARHEYGEACYREGGCSEIIERVSAQIDARKFNRNYPKDFPRFVQFALWAFCAQDELNTCNGNKVNDNSRCQQMSCPLYKSCKRKPLRSTR